MTTLGPPSGGSRLLPIAAPARARSAFWELLAAPLLGKVIDLVNVGQPVAAIRGPILLLAGAVVVQSAPHRGRQRVGRTSGRDTPRSSSGTPIRTPGCCSSFLVATRSCVSRGGPGSPLTRRCSSGRLRWAGARGRPSALRSSRPSCTVPHRYAGAGFGSPRRGPRSRRRRPGTWRRATWSSPIPLGTVATRRLAGADTRTGPGTACPSARSVW